MARLLRRVETIVPRRAHGYGGKGRNLAALARAGFPVPAAYALPGSACEEFLHATLPERDLPASLLATPGADEDETRLADIAARVRAAPLSETLRNALSETFELLRREGASALAVRSSSMSEDESQTAAAGMHATLLNITSTDALIEAVKACWASLFSPRVLSYLRTVDERPEAAMGIVVQAMVPAETSGVLFTVNPLTGDPGELVINASWGLGCGVMEGRVSPDTWRIDKSTGGPRDRIIGDKQVRIVTADGELREEEVTPDDRKRLCLDDATVEDLVELGLRIESHFGDARDVEWAIVDGQPYVLQARPVTTAVHPAPKRRARKKKGARDNRAKTVWSNANVGEALPGVATPLTWSVASNFSDLGFRRAFGSLGCTVPKDAELVGNFRGRIYLNLTESMEILSQVPGLKPRTLLSLGGGGELERLESDIEGRSPLGFLSRLPVTAARFARENFRLTERLHTFERTFDDERRRLVELDLRVLSPLALNTTLSDVEHLLDEAGSIMLTAYGNLLASMVLLRGVLQIVAPDRAERLQRDLITGLADVDSAAPGLSLWHIAETARGEPAARTRIRETKPAALRIADLPRGPTRRALENFVRAWGHRGPREAELSEPRWGEDPTLLFTTLRIHLRREGEEHRPIDVERRQRAVRERAEAELERVVPAPGRAAVRHLLALVQRFTRVRERLRGHVVEVLDLFRRIALDASGRLERQEPDVGADAAFFLTLDELHGVLRGDVPRVAGLVRRRRRQYDRDRALPDPPDTFVGFPPPVPPSPPDTDALHGLAASAGSVEGTARVLSRAGDIGEFQPGEILVTPSADVGLSPLFLVAGAVVTDLGGPLSHASIVLREYGVPAVVNVKVGTKIIRTGDRLRADAHAGVVEILRRAETRPTESEPPGATSCA